MRQESKHFYEFGPFRLDAPERLLLRDGKPVELTPKAFDTLVALVENSGHLLTKDELLKRLWPDSFVEEATLAKNVFTLRKALGSSPGNDEYIETVPTRGYRFVGDVREVTEGGPILPLHGVAPLPAVSPVAREPIETVKPETPVASVRPGRLVLRALLALSLAAAVIVVGMLARQRFWPPPSPPLRMTRLAVLPFANLSGDPAQEYFADGFTEEMITQLGDLEPGRLGVIARTSAMQYRNTQKLAGQIGRELGVDYLLEGSVRRSSDRVRISAQLIRVRDQTHLWAADFDRDDKDILALQSDVAKAIAAEINLKLLPEASAHRSPARPLDPEAYRFYLQGRFFWNKRTEPGYVKAVEYFNQALARDPKYAQAFAGLADAYALLGSLPSAEIQRREAMPRAKAAALTALKLDPSLAAAHTSLAFVRMHYEWDWPGAQQEFQRAIELNPDYPTAHQWYAYWFVARGRTGEALDEMHRAQQADPLSLIILTDSCEMLLYAGRYDQAAQQAQKALELDANFALAHVFLAQAYEKKRMYPQAITAYRKALALSPGNGWSSLGLGRIYSLAGQRAKTEAILKEALKEARHRGGMELIIAPLCALLGEKDQAFSWLEKAYQNREGGLILLKVAPVFDPLRADPRFADLERRVGLPQGD
ncbi:MAG: tetratricopeptide repeat protein [Acidipila sp.]|nr:tetratricopeptide repeat protein [Acidipila sp.]